MHVVGIEQLRPQKKIFRPGVETRQSHNIEYGVSKIILEDTERGIKVLRYCEVCSEAAHKYSDVQPEHIV